MVTLRLCWSIFAVWFLCWGTAPSLVSAQITYAKFELEKEIQYKGGVLDRRSARSILECAWECIEEISCFGFNFWSRECELLSVAASARNNNAPRWTHGHRFAGKYHSRNWEKSVPLDNVSENKYLYWGVTHVFRETGLLLHYPSSLRFTGLCFIKRKDVFAVAQLAHAKTTLRFMKERQGVEVYTVPSFSCAYDFPTLCLRKKF